MHQRHVNAKGLTQTPCSRIAQTHLSLTLLHTPFLRSALPSHLARTRTAPSTQFTIIRLMRLPVTKLECKMTSVLRWESMLALWWKARSLPTRSSAAMRTTTTKQTALIGVKTTSAGWTHAPATRPMWQHLLGSSPLSTTTPTLSAAPLTRSAQMLVRSRTTSLAVKGWPHASGKTTTAMTVMARNKWPLGWQFLVFWLWLCLSGKVDGTIVFP